MHDPGLVLAAWNQTDDFKLRTGKSQAGCQVRVLGTRDRDERTSRYKIDLPKADRITSTASSAVWLP